MKKLISTASLFLGTTMITFAQSNLNVNINTSNVATAGRVNDSMIVSLISSASKIISMLAFTANGLAVLAFFWFLINFIWIGKDDSKKQQESLKGMGYSILAIFVMVSLWGIVGLAGNIFGVGQGGSVPYTQVPAIGQQ